MRWFGRLRATSENLSAAANRAKFGSVRYLGSRHAGFAIVVGVLAGVGCSRGDGDAELARAKAEAEKAKAEAAKAQAEADKARAEADRAKAAATTAAPETKEAPPPAVAPRGGPETNPSITVDVTVAPQKPDGKAWDAAGGAPDIALCLSSALGTRCFPNGGNIGEITAPQCRDSFQCTFKADAPPGDITVEIVDVDLAVNDPIGSGACRRGSTCRLGQATVRIR